MSCCNDRHRHPHHIPDKFVDLSCIKPKDWDEIPTLVGITECNNLVPVNKPDYDKNIIIDGDGNSALYNDGKYKRTYNADEVDSLIEELETSIDGNIDEAIKDVVKYESDDEINPRKDIVLGNEFAIRSKAINGNKFDLIKLDSGRITTVGDTDNAFKIKTNGRPSVNIRNSANEEEIAYISDVDDLRTEVDGVIDNRLAPLEQRVTNVEGKTIDNANKIQQNTDAINVNKQSIIDLTTSTTNAFNTVNDTISALDDRVTKNSEDILVNSSDIESLREELNTQEKFRGYFTTNAEITALIGTVGDYAWSAESGTVWNYNGNSWFDTTKPIPDQTIDGFDGLPLVDGIASAGTSTRYSRGDHRHPSDITKANITDLDDYLPLAGNTQTTRMTGDIWLSTGNAIRLSNSGNSSVIQETSNSTTQITGNGVGGINLSAPNGTVKANNEDVVTYSSINEIDARGDILLKNDNNLFGVAPDGSKHNLIELSRFDRVDVGSTTTPMTLSASSRPKVQLTGETGDQAHDIAFIDDINSLDLQLSNRIESNSEAIFANMQKIAVNSSDIAAIQQDLANTDHFRGYYATTAEITALSGVSGDYAYNAQTGTKWIYNGNSWTDSGEIIPDQTVLAYEGLPLVDGAASSGTVNQYSRGDHRHPTDTSRASASELANTNQAIVTLRDDFESNKTSTDDSISNLDTLTASNTANISSLGNRVSTNESDISTLKNQAQSIGNQVNLLETGLSEANGRIDTNSSDIESLQQQVTNADHFRGYYATTAEITALAATNGDYAWNKEDGTVWIYNGELLTWQSSGEPIPTDAIEAFDGLPLIDGEASAGLSNEYSRGDHRHPTDTTRASQSDLEELSNKIGNYVNKGVNEGNLQVSADVIQFNSTQGASAGISLGGGGVSISSNSFSSTTTGSFNIQTSSGNIGVNTTSGIFTYNSNEVATVDQLPSMLTLTQAEYDAITTKNPETYYYIIQE